MADRQISQLNPLATADLRADDLVVINDSSADETKKIDVTGFLEGGLPRIPDGTIPAAKVSGTTTIPAGSVGTVELADAGSTRGGVTRAKLENTSTGEVSTTQPTNPYEGFIWKHETTGVLKIFDGSGFVDIQAGGNVTRIDPDPTGLVPTNVVTTNQVATISASLEDTTGAAILNTRSKHLVLPVSENKQYHFGIIPKSQSVF